MSAEIPKNAVSEAIANSSITTSGRSTNKPKSKTVRIESVTPAGITGELRHGPLGSTTFDTHIRGELHWKGRFRRARRRHDVRNLRRGVPALRDGHYQ